MKSLETFEMELAKRRINITYFFNISKESLENCFVVYYKDTNHSYLFNGQYLTESDIEDFISCFIRYIKTRDHTYLGSRDCSIIAKNGNVYFVS